VNKQERLYVPLPLVVITSLFLFFSTFTIAGEQITLGVLFILWVFYLVSRRIGVPFRTKLDLPIALFLISCAVSVAFSEDKAGSIINLRNLLLLSILYLFAYIFSRELPLSLFLSVLMISSIGTSIYGISMYLFRDDEWVIWRTPGPFSGAMTFGGVLMILCSLGLTMILCGGIPRRLRVLGAVSTVFTATALFFTFTRSSWLGMIVSAVVIMGFSRRKLIVPFIVALAVFVVILPQPYRSRFSSMLDPSYRTNAIRLQLIKGGIEIFKEHPIVGVGTRDLTSLYIKHKPPEATYISGHLHNNFLQIAVSMGGIGLAAFIYLFVSFFRVAAENLNRSPPLKRGVALVTLGVLTGFLVNGLFEWNFGVAEVVTLVYILIGFNLAILNEKKGGDNLIV